MMLLPDDRGDWSQVWIVEDEAKISDDGSGYRRKELDQRKEFAFLVALATDFFIDPHRGGMEHKRI